MSSLVIVHNSQSLFQSNVCNLFLLVFSCLPYYQGVPYSKMSTRREFTEFQKVGSSNMQVSNVS